MTPPHSELVAYLLDVIDTASQRIGRRYAHNADVRTTIHVTLQHDEWAQIPLRTVQHGVAIWKIVQPSAHIRLVLFCAHQVEDCPLASKEVSATNEPDLATTIANG